MIWPVSVCLLSDSSRLARPKSVILGMPSAVNRTLAGLRSRWTIPASWAAWTARASVTISSAACRPGWGVPAEPVGEAPAFEQLQRHERQAVDLADVVDLDDVGVPEPGDGLGLDAEPGEVVGPRLLPAADHLQGDQAVQAGLAGLVDDPHAPFAELLQDLVAGDRGPWRRTLDRRSILCLERLVITFETRLLAIVLCGIGSGLVCAISLVAKPQQD